MTLTIPDKVSWRKNIVADSVSHYNKNIAKRILKTHTHHTRDAIKVEILPLTLEHLEWFEPMYIEKIAQKINPQIINLYATTLEKTNKQFHILIISEAEVTIGAIIFSETATDINIAYKIFTDTWVTSTLPASPSLYADYLITEYGVHNHKKNISHGKDRNGYGMTSSIGLAIFKILLGYKPYIPKKYTEQSIDETTITSDTLYFISVPGKLELEGNLYTTTESQHKWERLNSYTDQVTINWIIQEN